MSRSVFAALMVLCGAVLGCLGYGVVFGLISSYLIEPSVQRATLFGLTFGATAGAGVGLLSVDATSGYGFAGKLPPRLVTAVILFFAAHLLFRQGGWDVVFDGSPPFALAAIAVWAGLTAWMAKEIAS